MRAAVCRAFGEALQIEELTLADPGLGEVEVDVRACAICHSDIHFAQGEWGGSLPAVYGHEASGVVRRTGPGVEDLVAGDHVVITLIRSCGSCRHCSRGDTVQCDATFRLDREGPLATLGGEQVHQGLGTAAFAERVLVHRSQLSAVPGDLPFDVAALLGCGVITGFGAVVNTAGVEPGAAVVVIGTGGVGLNAIQGAALSGANPVIAVDVSDDKLAAARLFGATHGVNPTEADVHRAVADITSGRRADYVFVTVGAGAAIEQGLELLGHGGTLVVVGMPAVGARVSFDPTELASDQRKILGSAMGSSRVPVDIPRLVGLYRAGRIKLDELITGRYPLEEVNDAIASVLRGEARRNVLTIDSP